MAPRIVRLGYFGKVPSTGDFVARNIDRGIRDKLDGWLQASIEESRRALGDAWMHSFLTAPVWRFLATQPSDGRAALGVMIPSVDKVGRYFPFLIVAELAPLDMRQESLLHIDQIVDLMEPLALSALDDDFDLDYLGYQLGPVEKQANALVPDILQAPRHAGSLDAVLAAGGDMRAPTLLWTDGSDYREADLIVSEGLPPASAFAALLRDANVFRDLEAVWEECRHLKLGQHDNAQVDIALRGDAAAFHGVAHPGKQGPGNLGFADISADRTTMVVSDGRFGAEMHAMVARFLCRAMPPLWDPAGGGISSSDIDRIVAFLSTRFQHRSSTLLPPLSFALVRVGDDGTAALIVAGDYLCLVDGEAGLVRLFSTAADPAEGTPTIRIESGGRYQMVTVEAQEWHRVLIAGNNLSHRAIESTIAEAMAAPDADAAALLLLQEAMIRGVSGNLVFGFGDTFAAVDPTGTA